MKFSYLLALTLMTNFAAAEKIGEVSEAPADVPAATSEPSIISIGPDQKELEEILEEERKLEAKRAAELIAAKKSIHKNRAHNPVAGGRVFQFVPSSSNGRRLVTNFMAKTGTPIRALWNGKVTSVSHAPHRRNGYMMRVKYDNGLESTLLFMGKKSALSVDSTFKAGTILSEMGPSGSVNRDPNMPFVYMDLRTESGAQLNVKEAVSHNIVSNNTGLLKK